MTAAFMDAIRKVINDHQSTEIALSRNERSALSHPLISPFRHWLSMRDLLRHGAMRWF